MTLFIFVFYTAYTTELVFLSHLSRVRPPPAPDELFELVDALLGGLADVPQAELAPLHTPPQLGDLVVDELAHLLAVARLRQSVRPSTSAAVAPGLVRPSPGPRVTRLVGPTSDTRPASSGRGCAAWSSLDRLGQYFTTGIPLAALCARSIDLSPFCI